MRIRLITTHTHAGKQYQPNETIVVDEVSGDWIVANARGMEVDEAGSVIRAPQFDTPPAAPAGDGAGTDDGAQSPEAEAKSDGDLKKSKKGGK